MLSTWCVFIDERIRRNQWFLLVWDMHPKDHAACTQNNWHETRWWPSLLIYCTNWKLPRKHIHLAQQI